MVKENTRRPKSGWRQLEFSTLICNPSPLCGIIFFAILSISGLILSSVILAHSYKIFEKSEDITNQKAEFSISSADLDDIEGDLFIYLEYLDYYQNHRIYLKSKSKIQLSGEEDSSISTDCEPLYDKDDLKDDLKGKISTFDDKVILPCGLMPASYIKTSIEAKLNGKVLDIDDSDIAWKTDDSKKYENQSNAYLDISDEHFKVWMRNSPTSRLNKLFGKIEENDLKVGKLRFEVTQGENILGYEPDMKVKISTNNRLGGKNNVLGWTFLVVAVLSLIWSIVFMIIAKYHKVPTFGEILEKRRRGG